MQNEGRLSTQGDSVDYFVSLGYVIENVEVSSRSCCGENDHPSGLQEKGPTCGTPNSVTASVTLLLGA